MHTLWRRTGAPNRCSIGAGFGTNCCPSIASGWCARCCSESKSTNLPAPSTSLCSLGAPRCRKGRNDGSCQSSPASAADRQGTGDGGRACLAPEIQEQVLGLVAVDGVEPMTERPLRRVLNEVGWGGQRRAFDSWFGCVELGDDEDVEGGAFVSACERATTGPGECTISLIRSERTKQNPRLRFLHILARIIAQNVT